MFDVVEASVAAAEKACVQCPVWKKLGGTYVASLHGGAELFRALRLFHTQPQVVQSAALSMLTHIKEELNKNYLQVTLVRADNLCSVVDAETVTGFDTCSYKLASRVLFDTIVLQKGTVIEV